MSKNMLHVEMYEDLFDLDYMDNTEEHLEKLRNKQVIKYRVKTIKSGPVLECEIYPIWTGAKTDKRQARKLNNTKKSRRNLNLRNAQKHLVRLCNANFSTGDMWATLGYDEEHLPATEALAKKDMQNYIRRLQRYIKKHKYPELKYIYVTEFGEARIHHHIIMNFPDRNIAEELWGKCMYPQARNLKPDDEGITKLAKYIGKEIGRKKKAIQTKSYTPSRNLKQPKITVADSKMTKRKLEKLATEEVNAHEVFERMHKNYQYSGMQIKHSHYVAGAYVYVTMKRIEPLKKRKDE